MVEVLGSQLIDPDMKLSGFQPSCEVFVQVHTDSCMASCLAGHAHTACTMELLGVNHTDTIPQTVTVSTSHVSCWLPKAEKLKALLFTPFTVHISITFPCL